MLLQYTLFRVSQRTERRLRAVAWVLAIPALAPIVVTQIAPYFLPVSFNVGGWFDPVGVGPSLFAGPWMITLGVFLAAVGTLIGNATLKDLEFQRSYDQSYRYRTHPFGWVSQVMIVCQGGAVIMLLGGILWTLAAFELL